MIEAKFTFASSSTSAYANSNQTHQESGQGKRKRNVRNSMNSIVTEFLYMASAMTY